MYRMFKTGSTGRALGSTSVGGQDVGGKTGLPYPAWISRNPDFRERYELCSVAGCLRYEAVGFINSALKIEPFWFSLRNSNWQYS